MVTDQQVDQFRRDGYTIARGVFSSREVAQLRAAVKSLAEQEFVDEGTGGLLLPSDLSVYPELAQVLIDDRVVELTSRLLGGTPVYFRDSTANIGGKVRGWHKDNRLGDRYDASTPDWDGNYPLLRMGIYLEDHVDHSGGLALRSGSHLNVQSARVKLAQGFWGLVRKVRNGNYIRVLASGMLVSGKPLHAPSRSGDIVVWNMRTTHSAHTVRLKGIPWLKLPPVIENRVPESFALPEDGERIVLFASFGLPGPHLDRMIEHLHTREYFGGRTAADPSAEFVWRSRPATRSRSSTRPRLPRVPRCRHRRGANRYRGSVPSSAPSGHVACEGRQALTSQLPESLFAEADCCSAASVRAFAFCSNVSAPGWPMPGHGVRNSRRRASDRA